ncbi:MAG: polysaccharide deacetylase family protein [Acidobacteria bacterium]|nr:polysaccharide deacetylase family protein [Acidobacteriota bacterium]
MLRPLRRACFGLLKGCGLAGMVASSRWRQRRLIILCYHGITIEDEDQWRPQLYMPQPTLRERFQLIRDSGCVVLPLGEALTRLYSGSLPSRSIAITFDDGGYDFYLRAYPIVGQFGFPVTVYQTTYYTDVAKPILNLACSYILWRNAGSVLPPAPSLGWNRPRQLSTEQERESVVSELLAFSEKKGMSGAAKDELAPQLAELVGFDYRQFQARRILQLMRPEEIHELSTKGVDFQLHTHRHRTPDDESLFRKELRDNRRRLQEITSHPATHFCYPSGVYRREYLPWLYQEGVVSATTCEPGIASPATDTMLLPRLVDTTGKTGLEFEAWLSGTGPLLARRPASLSYRSPSR